MANLEMIHADLPLALLKEQLNVDSAEGDIQQSGEFSLGGGIGQEVLNLPSQDIACHDQPSFRSGRAVFSGPEPTEASMTQYGRNQNGS